MVSSFLGWAVVSYSLGQCEVGPCDYGDQEGVAYVEVGPYEVVAFLDLVGVVLDQA